MIFKSFAENVVTVRRYAYAPFSAKSVTFSPPSMRHRMWTAMYEKMSQMEKYRKTGEFMHDLRVQEEMHRVIEEEILNEIVYVD